MWPEIAPEAGAAGGAAIMGAVFLGDDLLAWLVLALGGALLVGNVAAIVRPPERPREEGALEQAPVTAQRRDGRRRAGRRRVGTGLARQRLKPAVSPS